MKPFEVAYLCAESLLPPLGKEVRKRLLTLTRSNGHVFSILDVGGRKSHYTVGVPAQITVTDLPRQSELQKKLNLGINDGIIDQTTSRRSNIKEVLFDDMTCSSLPDETFDCVVSVEVLEHVEQDAAFVAEVYRVLRNDGVFLMTTPNGDFVRNTNPDHKRHYSRLQLMNVLSSSFEEVNVEYAIRGGKFRRWGLKSWSPKRPGVTALSMFGNVINTFESRGESIKSQASGTHHLIATAFKRTKTFVS